MTTFAAPPASPKVDLRDFNAHISRVPYLPGLDGMRALAVVAVMIYHANSTWLPGGFLGVEMFFVISGYLITLLIIAERERTYRVSLVDFWKRRARRLLPALGVLLLLVTVYTAIFEREALGQLRGDVIAGGVYGSNWYQLFVGLGYTAAFDFAPLRHLWSLAVEEQFYVVWPVVMVVLLGRRSTRKIANVSRWLFLAAIVIAIVTALLYHPGVIGEPEQTPEAYWWIGDRAISKLDFLYIGSFSRAAGILLGAAFAMIWRPYAVARGPLGRKGPLFDVVALLALAGFAWMCWNIYLVTPEGVADGRLFKGGLFLSSMLTIFVIAAVSHPGARSNRVLGNRVLVWIGVRSYGLYLFHWPIYQAIRGLAGNKLTVNEFVVAMILTVIVTELSFRFVETPIRTGKFMEMVRSARRSPNPGRRRVLVGALAGGTAMTLFAGATLATADLNQSEITEDLDTAQEATVDLASGGAGLGDGPRLEPTVDLPATPTTLADMDGRVVDFVPVTTLVPVPTTVPEDAETGGEEGAGEEPAPATTETDPADEAPVVPATTEPPAPPSTGPVQVGVITDLSAVTPTGIPAPANTAATAIPVIALGDSVMLGAAEELQARGVVVDAVKSRQFSAFLPELEVIRQNQLLGSVVVVHLGTNGPFPQTSLDRMMELLWDVPAVIFITSKADRDWVAGNNEKVRALPQDWQNVSVIDWEVLGATCPGDCFYDDDIHLNQAGQNYYADMVGTVIGI
jgi:peptidoglycan/LPS O-acetylase OafA/YrhL